MNRTALRIATKAALLAGGSGPAWPTIAGENVYDSRQDDVDVIAPDTRRPVIILRTDTDDRPTLTPRGGSSRSMELKIQLGVVTAALDDDGNKLTGWPATDSELEAFLDLLELGIESALLGPGPWGMWWRNKFLSNDCNFSSQALYSDPEEGRVRLAAREQTWKLNQFPADTLPPMQRTDTDEPYVAALPPELVEVFDYVDSHGGGNFKVVCMGLRAKLEAQTLPPAGRYGPLVIIRAGIDLVGKTPPPHGQADAPQVTANLLPT